MIHLISSWYLIGLNSGNLDEACKMKHSGKHGGKHNSRILTLLALLAVIGFPTALPVSGQNLQQPAATPEPQQGGDLIRQLNLTPEQREQIRGIRGDKQVERALINQQLRQSNRALQEALEADVPDEAVVEQRVREVAAAQASVMRMRIMTEIRIRRVLTTEQRALLKSLQQEAINSQRERGLANPDQTRRAERRRALRNQRNGLEPLLPQRENKRRPQL
jgi:Spy/CpxP family protein refolding chaperone